ncbi:metal ABC transporter ATP-binding protein [Palleronia rufa]
MSGLRAMSLVALERIVVAEGGRQILSGVDLAIDRGEIVTIVGPNGSGKTTLLRTVLGAVRPRAGRVRQAPGLRIGYVPQRLALDPTLPMSVGRFMALPARPPAGAVPAALAEAGLPDIADQPLASLSAGQMQRALLARALLSDPDLLVLDEPTAGLDQPGSAAFYRRIESLRNARGCAVLMVSHDLHVVMAASDRVICLNGHVCCEGTPESVASAPAYRALFGEGTRGALALYRHEHGHSHDHGTRDG